jgi:flagellar basal-body rod protein FlgB
MSILDGVEHLRAGLDYHLARHNLLTANLSHVDTPGYRPLDLKRNAIFESTLQTAMATTQVGHLQAPESTSNSSPWQVVEDTGAQATGADGNAVSLDREAVKIAANQLRYDTIASLTQNELSGLVWAANDGRGA